MRSPFQTHPIAFVLSVVLVTSILPGSIHAQESPNSNTTRRPEPPVVGLAEPSFGIESDDEDSSGSEGGIGLSLDDAFLDGGGDLDSLLDADLEQLVNTDVVVPIFNEEVTTVSRQESTVGRSPAAVYVITGEMIRRSGVRSIPEALRLAPGVNVAKLDANKWSISVRGFQQRFANKLLVQIDGRTVYTPFFGGVYWDIQDVLLEDVDRIEVVRGPGASVWGANAVNGIINIITKTSFDTHGFFAEAGGGDQRGFASTRIGGVSNGVHWRAYGKWFERDSAYSPTHTASDDWRSARGGFRVDYNPSCCETVTLQGDYYNGTSGQYRFNPLPTAPFLTQQPTDEHTAGGNVLFRYTRQVAEKSDWSMQVYYDRTERGNELIAFREDRDIVDLDFQHRFAWNPYNSIVWGLGYRNSRDRIRNSSFSLTLDPTSRADDTFSTFIQDEIQLVDERLALTLGSKFSWNDYTNFEAQPTARLLFTPSNRESYWTSFSRAVRVPTRVSDDIRVLTTPSNVPVFPTYFDVRNNRDLDSEEVMAWELGVRKAPTDNFYWDFAAFYNQYNELSALRAGAPTIDPVFGQLTIPLTFFNGADADTYGFELVSTWNVHERWTLRGAYSFLRIDIRPEPSAFANAVSAEGQTARNTMFIHSSWDIGCNWEFDLIGRYVDILSANSVPSYLEMDTRIAWRPTSDLEVALVGRQLLDGSHPEQSSDTFIGTQSTEVLREVFGVITLRR